MKKRMITLIMAGLFSLTLAVVFVGCGGGGGSSKSGDDADKSAPTTPANLNATAVSSSQIDLSWDAATDTVGVAGYKIYRDGTYLKSVTEISVSDTELSGSTEYCYKVSAYDAENNESSQSIDACATTQAEWKGTKQLGTASYDFGWNTAVDMSGNVFITGGTGGDLDGNINAGDFDMILIKYDASGVKQWTKQLGTVLEDSGYAVTTDTGGNIYVVGTTLGDLGETNAGDGNEYDIFLVKYDTAGTELWRKQLGTAEVEDAPGVAVDASGNIYVSGTTYGDMEGTNAGNFDIFLVKYNADGVKQWTRQFGTKYSDECYSIALDLSGNIYLTGLTYGDLDGETNAGGNFDMFLAKYNAAGEKQWTKLLGTTADDYGYGVTTDAIGNIYVTGVTSGDLDGANMGETDIFLVKYNSAGESQWIKQSGTISDDYAMAITVDVSGNIFVTGSTYDDMDGDLEGTNAGEYDMFLVKYDDAGTKVWTRQLGTPLTEEGYGVATDVSGNVFVTGYTFGNMDGNTNAGEDDIFLVKYDTNGVKQ